jgi:hypothetical protein
MERCGGKNVELRHKEYICTVPRRGMSKYVVFEIVEIEGAGS